MLKQTQLEHSKRQRINAKKGWARRDRKKTVRQAIEDELYRKIHRLAQKVKRMAVALRMMKSN